MGQGVTLIKQFGNPTFNSLTVTGSEASSNTGGGSAFFGRNNRLDGIANNTGNTKPRLSLENCTSVLILISGSATITPATAAIINP